MKKEYIFISKIDLEYNIMNKVVSNHFDGEYKGLDIPSTHFLNLKYDDEIYLPLTLFQDKFTPLQIIIKYLRESLISKPFPSVSVIVKVTFSITYGTDEVPDPEHHSSPAACAQV